MGANNSQMEEKILSSFKVEELKSARIVYNTLINDQKTLDLEKFSSLFSNDIEFGIKLYKCLHKQKKLIEFTDYLCMFQTLSKEQNKLTMPYFKGQNLNKIQIFSLILLEQYNCNDISKLMITKEELENIILHLLMIFEIENLDEIMTTLQSRINGMFDQNNSEYVANSENKISLRDATWKIEKIFNVMNQIMTVYFQNKFLHRQIYFPIPNMSSKSGIVSEELISLLYMNNLYFQPSDNLTLLHNSSTDGMSLQTVINNLLGYNSQTLILLRSGKSVFGIFNSQPWRDQKEFQGDEHSFIFQLKPHFQIFSSNLTQKNRNFAYMNSKSIKNYDKFKAGIGFGGSVDGLKYRLWLDEVIFSESYINFSDDCFEPGWIVQPNNQQIKQDKKMFVPVDSIEAWGLGNEDHYQNQKERKIRNYNASTKARKINKKLLFSLLTDFDKQIFFSQTFNHLTQIRWDVMDCCQNLQNELDESQQLPPERRNIVQQIRVEES